MSLSSSPVISFKCCKSKHFIHYICVKCSSVFHKSCLPRLRKQISFLKENKIICCKDENESYFSDLDKDNSLLEKTVADLQEDSEIKNNYIQRLKRENKLFMEEAIKMEDEMSQTIQKQETIVRELEAQIRVLRKNSSANNRIAKNESTQINLKKITNDKSTSVVNILGNVSGVGNLNLNRTAETSKINSKIISNNDKSNSLIEMNNSIPTLKEPVAQNHKKLLILGDDLGRNINKLTRQRLGNSTHQIESIIKPGASYMQVIHNVEVLTRTYSTQDHIIILAGSNDFSRDNRYPRFRDISDAIKKCSTLNIILATVPLTNDFKLNRFINKFNNKLSDFVTKLNNYISGSITLLKVNRRLTNRVSKHDICDEIIKLINMKTLPKNITFIKCSDTDSVLAIEKYNLLVSEEVLTEVLEESSTSCVNKDDNKVTDGVKESELNYVNEINLVNSSMMNDCVESPKEAVAKQSFLYPRLSQLQVND